MHIIRMDHLVITTQNLSACLAFYGEILGMSIVHVHGRYAVQFGNQKLNIHTKKAEFLLAADHPTYGCLDLCFVVDEDIQSVKHVIEAKGYPVEEGPVCRHGALWAMNSIYLRDPDSNLIELCSYQAAR